LRPSKTLRKALNTILQQKIEDGALIECTIDSMPSVYTTQNILDTNIKKPATNVRLLSPFDNAIIHRDRVQQLFEFDYKFECYVPKEKRKFGYFCLPILYKDRLVGRVDCKAHRKTSDFELVNLHLESKKIDVDYFIPYFTKLIYRFAAFNNCRSIRISNVNPKKLTSVFKRALSSS